MSTQHPTHTQTRTRRRARRGQSMVEYALTLALLVLVVQGTVRVLFNVVGTSLVSVRNRINTADDLTATPGPSPTIHLPPQPATLTSLPATATVIQMCTVPNLSNLQYVAAVAEWLNYGFSPGTLAQPSGKPNNMIVGSQSLVAGGSQKPCATTTMTVYAKQCTVPNLVGQIFTVARDGAWTTNEFFAENLSAPNNADLTLPIGSQQYAANSKIDCDQTMSVTLVPPTPTLCTVPDLSGKTISSANSAWTTARFTSALNNPFNITGTSIKVATQELVANTLQPCSTPMWVKPLTCVVPDLSGDLYTAATANGGSFKSVCSAATLSKAWGTTTPADRVIGSTGPVAGTEIINDSSIIVTANEMQCTVPNMSGQLYSAATANGGAWKNAQFTFTLSKAWGTTAPTDRVIGTTSPAAGSSVACSSGAVTANLKQCTVPNLQNMTFAAASTQWTQNGFTSVLGRDTPAAPTTGEFTVGTQTLTANTSASCSATTTMKVGPKMCTVSNLNGMLFSAASAKWTQDGFTSALGRDLTTAPDTGEFIVSTQSRTASATSIDCASTMLVGQKMCTVPNLSTKNISDARTTWTNAGFIGALDDPWNITGTSATITSQQYTTSPKQLCSISMSVKPATCVVPDLNGYLFDNVTGSGEPFKVACSSTKLVRGWGPTTSLNLRIGTTSPVQGTEVVNHSDDKFAVTANEMMCTVPDLQNMTFTAASAKWTLDGFTSTLGRDTTTAPSTGGFTVSTQTQTAGDSLACSSPMLAGLKMCTVPPMSGKSFAEANTAWTGAGFTGLLQNPLNVTGSIITLASQQYGTSPQMACTTSMWVKPLTCKVPDLNGDLYSAAVAAGGTFKSVCSNAVLQKPAAWGSNDGRIGSTNPVFDTEIIDHSSSTVTINEMMCTVPKMLGMQVSTARTTWAAAKFTSALTINTSGSTEAWWVATQNPTSGSTIACSSGNALTTEATPVKVAITVPSTDGGVFVKPSDLSIQATAWDTRSGGTTNGADISNVVFTITGPNGSTYLNVPENTPVYCASGGTTTTCYTFSQTVWNTMPAGTYTITALATSKGTGSPPPTATATRTFVKQLSPLYAAFVVPASDNAALAESTTDIEVNAYDPSYGTANGNGVSNVEFTMTYRDKNGNQTYTRTDTAQPFCVFGGNGCNTWTNSSNPKPLKWSDIALTTEITITAVVTWDDTSRGTTTLVRKFTKA